MRQSKSLKMPDGALLRETGGTNATWQYAREEDTIALIDPKPLTRQAVSRCCQGFPDYKAVAVSSCNELPELKEAPRLVIVYVRSASAIDGWVQRELRLISLRCQMYHWP